MSGKPHIRRDLTGQRFGLLLVLGPGKHIHRERPGKKAFHCRFWRCRCECGNETEVALGNLTSGLTISCGCRGSRKTLGDRRRTHGLSTTHVREYTAWKNMRTRCYSKKSPEYKNYGARGIDVCERWRNNCAAFFEDMGLCPDGMTLDRIDNNKGYAPENCHWVSPKDNCRNMRRTLMLTFNGETKPLKLWAEELRMCYETLKNRLDRGWSTEQTLSTPPLAHDMYRVRYLTFDGRTQTMKAWALALGMKHLTLAARLKRGWSVEEALSTPLQESMRR